LSFECYNRRLSPEHKIEVKQEFPREQILPLEGLYLSQGLRKIAERLGRPIVIANYVSDKNDVIANQEPGGDFQVPVELKNSYDWRLFQELTAQADVIITGTGYLKRFAKMGEKTQNVLTQFEPGGEYEELGNWRLKNGYKSRNPDIVVASRSLDFDIPKVLTDAGRKIIVFTTHEMAKSPKARELEEAGVRLVGAGSGGVDGKLIIDFLGREGYKVIKMTTGPRILKILLDSRVLDRLYVTQVQKEIRAKPENVQRIRLDGGKVSELPGFGLTAKYIQEDAVPSGDTKVPQHFLIYDSEQFLEALNS